MTTWLCQERGRDAHHSPMVSKTRRAPTASGQPPQSSSTAGPSSSVGVVLHDSHDLLPEIINHLAAIEGVRALPRIAAVCKHWRRVAVPLASSWAMLKCAGPAFPLVADKPMKASFVCSMPTSQARGRAPAEQGHSSLVVASVGKDIRIFCPRSGVALAEIQTAPGVWPSGLACDGRHLFAAGSLDCTLYKLEIVEASMEIVEACGGFGSGEAQLHSPQGLALHGSTLFVADSGNGRVAVWDATPTLRYRSSIGSKGSGEGQLLRPSGLAVDAEHLYVADSGNHRVCKFTHGGTFCLAIGGYGEAPGQFMLPRGVALCGEQLLVAEEGGKRVQVLTRDGAPRGQLREPCFGGLLGICVDPAERRAFAIDRQHNVVHVLDVCFGGRLHGRQPLLHESPRSAGKRKRTGGTGGSGGSGGSASSSGPQTRQRTRVRRD